MAVGLGYRPLQLSAAAGASQQGIMADGGKRGQGGLQM